MHDWYLYIDIPCKDYERPKPLLNIVKNTMRSSRKKKMNMCDIENEISRECRMCMGVFERKRKRKS